MNAQRSNGFSSLVINLAAITAISCAIAGCTLYKSADRDKFNENPLAGAPTPQPSVVAITKDCADDRDLSSVLNDSVIGPALRSQGKVGYFVKSASSPSDADATTGYTVLRLHSPATNSTRGVECTFQFPADASPSEIERVSERLVEEHLD